MGGEMKLKLSIRDITLPIKESDKDDLNIKERDLKVSFKSTIFVQVKDENVFYETPEPIEKNELIDEASLTLETSEKLSEKTIQKIKEKYQEEIRALANEYLLNGECDEEIKEQYKKAVSSHEKIFNKPYKEKVKITKADIVSSSKAASRKNKIDEEKATWIPKEGDSRKSIIIPTFIVRKGVNGAVIGTYNDIKQACIELQGLSYGNVRLCLRKKRETVEGFHFEFLNPDDPVVIEWLRKAAEEAGDED